MKKTTLLLAVFLCNFIVIAQNANLDRKYYKVSYVDLPAKPILDDAKRTYDTNYSSIGISGFSRVNNDPSLEIDFKYFGTEIGDIEIKKTAKEKKDKDGNVISTTYTYRVHVPYTSTASLNVNNNVNPDQNYSKQYKETENYSSSSFSTYYKAQSFYNNNKYNLRNKRNSSHKSKIVSSVNADLNYNYGYTIRNKQDLFWILGTKKHPEIAKHVEAYEKAKVVFEKMKYDEPVDGLKPEFQPIIDYFEGVIPNYTSTKKRDKKMRYASYFNIAKMYYYLDDFNKTKEYAQKLIDNDYDKGDGKSLIRQADKALKTLSTNKMETRHMKVVTSKIAPVEEVVENNTSAASDMKLSKAYLLNKKGDTLLVDILDSNLKSIALDVKTAKYDNTGSIIGSNIVKANEVKELFFLDGTRYKNVAFKESSIKGDALDGGKVLKGASEKLCKLIFESDKYNLYLYNNTETVIVTPDSEKGKSTQSPTFVFGFKKQLAKIAEGCPALLEKVESKAFKNTQDDLIKFGEELKACE